METAIQEATLFVEVGQRENFLLMMRGYTDKHTITHTNACPKG